jgi:hypothetical protein
LLYDTIAILLENLRPMSKTLITNLLKQTIQYRLATREPIDQAVHD